MTLISRQISLGFGEAIRSLGLESKVGLYGKAGRRDSLRFGKFECPKVCL